MSNVPRALPPIKAYESSPLTIRLDMYSGFVFPGEIAFEIHQNRVKQYEVTANYDPSTRRITARFEADQIRAMRLIADCVIRFGADFFPLQVQIKPTSDSFADDVVGYQVEQAGDSYTVVEILGLEIVQGQVEIAQQHAETATQGAQIATQKAAQTSADREQVELDKIAINDAVDQVLGPLARKLDVFEVDTFADMEAFIAIPGTPRCGILVLEDEMYGGEPRMHLFTGSKLVQFITYT